MGEATARAGCASAQSHRCFRRALALGEAPHIRASDRREGGRRAIETPCGGVRMAKVSIADLDLKGKRVLIRVDFNVPLNDKQEVTDDTRIRAALPTIQHSLSQGARVLLLSHLGRPKGKVVPGMSLAPVAARLSQLLGQPVAMASDCIGKAAAAAVAALQQGQVVMLGNCRFHVGDEKNDEAMSRALAELCDIFVNDAFGAAHRAHASTVGVTKFVPVSACGLLSDAIPPRPLFPGLGRGWTAARDPPERHEKSQLIPYDLFP